MSKSDWLVWMVVFLGCLFVGIDWGLLFGVGLAVLIQLGCITFPTLHVLGRLPDTALLRSVPALCWALGCNKKCNSVVLCVAKRMSLILTVHADSTRSAGYMLCCISPCVFFTILEMYISMCTVMASASISYTVKR